MSDGLRSTLERLSGPGAEPNAAFDVLLADYARFHLVLAVLALVAGAAVGTFAVFAWRRAAARDLCGRRRLDFPRVVDAVSALGASVFGLLMGLVAVANLSNARDPRTGLRGSIGAIRTAAPGTRAAEVQRAFDAWLRSGDATVPPAVQDAVDDRLAWQLPKAIICSILLALVVVGTWRVWRSLLARTRAPGHRWSAADLGRFGLGLVLVGAGFLLTLMVMGNTQASMAPLAMTLVNG